MTVLGRHSAASACPQPESSCSVPHTCRCAALRGIRDDIEKEHAFLGLCALLRLNPQVRLLLLLMI